MMTSDKKLAFLHKMAKLGVDAIPHYDLGGLVGGASIGGASIGGAIGGVSGAGLGALAGGTGLISAPQGQGLGGIASNILGTENNFNANAAPISSGVAPGQVAGANTTAQNNLGNQNLLVNQTLPGAVQSLNTQSALSGTLANQAAGVGPNPAQAALNQSTGQNINAQAALQASQRGAGANAGATAVNAARQGADIQQQAVGQAATLQAQQQIAAQQQQEQLAAQQFAQAQGAVQGQTAAGQNEQGILQGANSAYNNAITSAQGNVNATNAQVAAGNQAAHGNAVGGLLSGASSALSALFAEGGEVHKMAAGGYMAPTPLIVAQQPVMNAPQSAVGQFLNSGSSAGQSPAMVSPMQSQEQPGYSKQADSLGSAIGNIKASQKQTGEIAGGPDASDLNKNLMVAARGGMVKKMLPPMHGKNMALIARGGKVKAEGKSEKAVANKDDYANDKVPALLSEGEVVIDKNTLNDPGQLGQMARTVAQHIAMKNSAKGRKSV